MFGNRDHIRYANGVESTWSYDPARVRLTAIHTNSGAVELQDLTYSYDPGGNPKTIQNSLADLTGGSGTLPGKSKVDFTYDGVDRLVTGNGTAQLSQQKTTTYDQRFGYSLSHSLTHKQREHTIIQSSGSTSGPTATNFASDFLYSAARPHLPTQIGSMLVSYDGSGNPTSRRKLDTGAVQTMLWDDDNRMVSFSGGNANQRNSYDAAGNRVRRKSTHVPTSEGGNLERVNVCWEGAACNMSRETVGRQVRACHVPNVEAVARPSGGCPGGAMNENTSASRRDVVGG